MAQNDAFSNYEMTFFPIKYQVCVFASLEDSSQKTAIKGWFTYTEVIH